MRAPQDKAAEWAGVELSDATGTLPLSNAGGTVTAEELQRSILAAQAQLLSEVLPSSEWIGRH